MLPAPTEAGRMYEIRARAISRRCRNSLLARGTIRNRATALRSTQGDKEPADLYEGLRERIVSKYLDEFPAYSAENDAELLNTRALEAIKRAEESFSQNLSEDSDDVSSESSSDERTFAFFTNPKTQQAAADYVWDREIKRLVSKEKSADDKGKLVMTLANIFIFTPIAWGFISQVPTREINEVYQYVKGILTEFFNQNQF